MTMGDEVPAWLAWVREIHQIGQTGLYYSQNEFDRERFQRLVGLSAEFIQKYSTGELENIQVALNAQPGYVTPKVDVRGAVFRGEDVLMVKEITDGRWSLPGGWADVNEAPSKMVEREVSEETGLRVKAKKLVAVYEANHDREPVNVFHSYKLLFLCDEIEGELRTSFETPEVRFFNRKQLPELSLFRTQERYIDSAFRHKLSLDLPTEYD